MALNRNVLFYSYARILMIEVIELQFYVMLSLIIPVLLNLKFSLF